MPSVKVIKVLGTSTESWEDAAKEALREADRTVDGVRGVEIEN